MDTSQNLPTAPFLLTEGGPLYRIEKGLRLISSRSARIRRRALIYVLLTWVVLFVLCVAQGTAFGHGLEMPFLKDFSAYTRFFLVIPLLVGAETFLGPRVAEAAEHFVTSGLVEPKDFQRFDEAIKRGLRLRDSLFAEIVMVILSYALTMASSRGLALHASTWRAIQTDAGTSTTWAGWWLVMFCVPLLQFLLLRWLWRLFLWFQFLGRMRDLDLQLFPTHPDEAGGLGFVGETQRFFGVLLVAYSLAVSGALADQIVFDRIPLQHFAGAIVAYVILGVFIVVGPLVLFTKKLITTKRVGLREYGTLATTYTGSFDEKWIRGDVGSDDPLLGTGDIQSLADLGNSYQFIGRMNPIPLDLRTLLHLMVVTLLPMTPLLFTVMPPKEVAKLLLKVLV